MGVVALFQARLASSQRHEIYGDQAQRCLITAIEIAQEQSARMWELRASLVPADIPSSQRYTLEALELLEALAVHFDPHSRAADIHALYARIHELRRERQHRCVQPQGDCLESVVEASLACQPPPSDL